MGQTSKFTLEPSAYLEARQELTRLQLTASELHDAYAALLAQHEELKERHRRNTRRTTIFVALFLVQCFGHVVQQLGVLQWLK